MDTLISPLLTLPNEIFNNIAKRLENRDVLSLLQTHSTLQLPLVFLLVSRRQNDALLYGAQFNNPELVKLALSAGADVTCRKMSRDNSKGFNGTALHRAAVEGNTVTIAELLRFNHSLEVRDSHKETPLFIAARHGHQAAVDQLLAAGADPSAESRLYESLFDTAVASGLDSTATQFIDQAAQKSMRNAIVKKRLAMASLLATRGFPSAPFIRQAALAGVGFVKLCLADGAPINKVHSSTKSTVLSIAVKKGDVELVQYLLDNGANPNTGPQKNRVPIMSAVRHGSTDVVRALLKHGVDLTGLKKPGADVLALACAYSPPEIVAMLLDAGQGLELDGKRGELRQPGPLHCAADYGNVEVIWLLLKRGANVHARRGRKGETPLHWAARKGNFEAVIALLNGGADPMIRCHAFTALMVANHTGTPPDKKERTMAALVRGGADINELDTRSRDIVRQRLEKDEKELKA